MSIPLIVPEKWINEIEKIFHDEQFREIEIKLNYVFKNKGYLISAFTHRSKTKNSMKYSYERY